MRQATVLAMILCVAASSWAMRPSVVSTDPVNGATGVAADLETITVSFSEEMGGGYSFIGLSGFDAEWSPDHRVITMRRSGSALPWSDGELVIVVLNPSPHYSFRDVDGNELATYTFAFTVGAAPIPGAPTVMATTPANGAADVDIETETITVEFSKAMADATDVSVVGPWPVTGDTHHSWSADGRTLTVGRDDAPDPLPSYEVATVYLNADGSGFEDLGGNQLGPYAFTFTLGGPGPDEPPSVLLTDPVDGARGVGVFTETITFVFDKPMTFDFNMVCDTGNWDVDGSGVYWEPDGRSFQMWRPDDEKLLPPGAMISFTLNPGGAPGFRDLDGKPLPPTTISFNVEGGPRVLKVCPEDSNRDFDWPYYLWIPQNAAPVTAILVEPNNSGFGSDEVQRHQQSAMSLLGWRSRFAERLNVPLLVPAFPRPYSKWWIYTHALDVDTMTTEIERLARIDLQIIEMIDDARERLAERRIQAGEKVLMMGFSASGQFTNRFAILHPERILAAAAGSPGGWPLAPVATWQGETLDYHVGIADVESILDRRLDMNAVRAAPIFLYMGASDTNDSVPFGDAYDDEQRQQVNRLFGTTPVERWPAAEAIYDAVGMNATFELYPGVGHTISEEMFDDIADFFLEYLPPQDAWLRTGAQRREVAP
ncbi:MAG: Ig-like domain-containing protein [Thermoanaerobaculales bacterium]|jgi:hypothetical protein|nr:Ig-like domain-containing protein [Thermoanaerobaculales bacterium]